MLSEREIVKLYDDALEAVSKNYISEDADTKKATIYESIVFGLGRVLEHEFTRITSDIVNAKRTDTNEGREEERETDR